MFKDAAALDRQRTATSFDKALSRYAAQAERWFDGTVDSVDRRLGACDRLLHSVRFTVARLSSINDARRYLYAAGELDTDRRALVALREDLLTGGAGREDVVGPPGWRTAMPQPSPGMDPGGSAHWVPGGIMDESGNVDRSTSYGNSSTNTGGRVQPHEGPVMGYTGAKPPGAMAGSNEFENPAPRTKSPRYLNDTSVTKVRTKALPVLKGGGLYTDDAPEEVGDHALPGKTQTPNLSKGYTAARGDYTSYDDMTGDRVIHEDPGDED